MDADATHGHEAIVWTAEAAQKKWPVLNGKNRLPKIIEGVSFKNGLELESRAKNAPPEERLSPTLEHKLL